MLADTPVRPWIFIDEIAPLTAEQARRVTGLESKIGEQAKFFDQPIDVDKYAPGGILHRLPLRLDFQAYGLVCTSCGEARRAGEFYDDRCIYCARRAKGKAQAIDVIREQSFFRGRP